MAEGYWWCPECEEEVGSNRVLFGEKHDTCGHPVTWIEPDATNWQRQCAEVRKLFAWMEAKIKAKKELARLSVETAEKAGDELAGALVARGFLDEAQSLGAALDEAEMRGLWRRSA